MDNVKIMTNNRQIIGIVTIIFVALVGYKFVSSGIQENKEKAVLQEKYNMEQQAKEPLNQCLDGVDGKLEVFSDLMSEGFKDRNMPGATDRCESYNKSYAASHGLVYKQGSCSLTMKDVIFGIEAKRKELEPERQECYKRYK